MSFDLTRRTFLAGSGALGLASSNAAAARPAPSDRITVGMIGVGARSHELLEAIQQISGTEIMGVCDAYTGRVERAIERTGGRAKAYKNHQDILADKSIDVVTVGTPDHLHKQIVVDALKAGKDVYCEKPLTFSIEEGHEIIKIAKETGKLVQVGSQGMSSATQKKARDIIRSGKLGQVTMVRAAYNRNSAEGAWIYPIPPDASPKTVNWDMFLGNAPKHPFDLERFFRWRCYWDYSGGIATDLFVHLCTSIHFVMGAKMPSSAVGMGQLYRWKESRNVPDTIEGVLEYPEGFMAALGCSFNNQYSSGDSFQFLGTDGTLVLGGSGLRFIPERKGENTRWITNSWPRKLQETFYQDPEIRRVEMPDTLPPAMADGEESFREQGWDPTVQHFVHFFESVRTRKPTVEDAVAGHHAAACAHLVNASVREKTYTFWDFDRDDRKV